MQGQPHHVMIQETMSEGLAQGPYVAARVEFEPATLQTQSTEPTTEPPCPSRVSLVIRDTLNKSHPDIQLSF